MSHQHNECAVGCTTEVVAVFRVWSSDAGRSDDSSHHTNVAVARERNRHEISHSTLKKEWTELSEGTSFPDRP
jgi:hypothetical protein